MTTRSPAEPGPVPPPVVDAWGIQQDWVDSDEQDQRVPDELVDVVRRLVGEPPEDLEETAPVFARPGADLGLGPVTVTTEGGERVEVDGPLPETVPLGYHVLHGPDGGPDRMLVVSPGACWLPPERQWGLTAQLYAARSRASWGIGDLGDLRTLCEWTGEQGGSFVLVNPLHAVPPVRSQETSPYLPATRRWRNPLYLRVESVPGFEETDLGPFAADVAALQAEGVAGRPVDRDAAFGLKYAVLRETFDRTQASLDPAFLTWRREQGPGLELFATWSRLCQEHGADWHDWPLDLQSAASPSVAVYAETHGDDVSFHAWLQWLLELQLRSASEHLTVLQDLPIGVSGTGADAWVHQDVVATGASVGAPPDALNSLGQDWGSPPLVPWRLRASGYAPFIEAVRGTMAAAGGLRIDHVMGLFRLWWVPAGRHATEGAYVHYPSSDLLDIVALESHRAQGVVIGEDLGTVPPGVREELEERGMLGYKVLCFEDDDPSLWPESALAAVTTHDLATVAGLWNGSDVVDQAAATGQSEAELAAANADLVARLRRDGLPLSASDEEAVAAAYGQLSRAPSLLLSVALEDVVHGERRPNVPGTTERDNWCVPLPVLVDDLVVSPGPPWLAGLTAT